MGTFRFLRYTKRFLRLQLHLCDLDRFFAFEIAFMRCPTEEERLIDASGLARGARSRDRLRARGTSARGRERQRAQLARPKALTHYPSLLGLLRLLYNYLPANCRNTRNHKLRPAVVTLSHQSDFDGIIADLVAK